LEKIDLGDNKLTKLTIKNCQNLKQLWCSSNQLTELNLIDSGKSLKEFICRDNFLTDIDYSNLSYKELACLSIKNNDLKEEDLKVFSKFSSLREL